MRKGRLVRCIFVFLVGCGVIFDSNPNESSADFRPDYKEVACKVESKSADQTFKLGLRFFSKGKAILRNLLSYGRPFEFDNLEISFGKNSEAYVYWRPNRPDVYFYGYSNSCKVTRGSAKPVKGKPIGEDDDLPVTYGKSKNACCMIWQRLAKKTIAGPQTAVAGRHSGDLRNQAYITGWYGKSDCSGKIPVKDEPDFIQTIVPAPNSNGYSFNAVATEEEGKLEAFYQPLDLLLDPTRTLKMSISHPGQLDAACTLLDHTFSKRPPLRPHPPFNFIPPLPKKDFYRPFVDKKDFEYGFEPYKSGSG